MSHRHQAVPKRFRRAVEVHVIKNLLEDVSPGTPLILALHGPAGDGKTYQVNAVLEELQVAVHTITSSDLEDAFANEPAQLLRRVYHKASDQIAAKHADVAAIVINDIDAAIGDWGPMVQYTVNRQTVIGELMHFCDFPNSVRGKQTFRIPIFLTANDLTKMYGPLKRPGRMAVFHWKPTAPERREVIARIYPDLSTSDVARLEGSFEAQPLAFFADLRQASLDAAIEALLDARSAEDLITDALANELSLRQEADVTSLLKLGSELCLERARLRNYATDRSDEVVGRAPEMRDLENGHPAAHVDRSLIGDFVRALGYRRSGK